MTFGNFVTSSVFACQCDLFLLSAIFFRNTIRVPYSLDPVQAWHSKIHIKHHCDFRINANLAEKENSDHAKFCSRYNADFGIIRSCGPQIFVNHVQGSIEKWPIIQQKFCPYITQFTYNTVHFYGMDSKQSIIKGLHCSHMLDKCNEASHTEKPNNNKKGKWV